MVALEFERCEINRGYLRFENYNPVEAHANYSTRKVILQGTDEINMGYKEGHVEAYLAAGTFDTAANITDSRKGIREACQINFLFAVSFQPNDQRLSPRLAKTRLLCNLIRGT